MKSVNYTRERCLSCHSCEIACAVEHSDSKDIFTAIFESVKPVQRIFVESSPASLYSLPLKCSHCEPAPCVNACPSGAIQKNQAGKVTINENICISCRSCLLNCPFGVITFDISKKGATSRAVAIKCDDCTHKTQHNSTPACVLSCKSGALQYCEIHEETRSRRINALRAMEDCDSYRPIPSNIALFNSLKQKLR